jgi:exodeoxyribonuclease V beta subunit
MAFELIEASAGTGKTYSITSKYLLLLLDRGLAVDQILVLTFTEAATAELRDRIRVRIREIRDLLETDRLSLLDDALLGEALGVLTRAPGAREKAVKRLTNAIISFDEAAIFTIHGFCTRVLREQAFATGMDFSAEVLTDDLPVLESVVADFARSCLGGLTTEEFGWCVDHGPMFGGARENDWRVTGRLLTPKDLRVLHTIISNPLMEIVPAAVPLERARASKDPATVALAVAHDLIAFARTGLTQKKRELRVMSFGDMLINVRNALVGPGGRRLAESLRNAYPAALIDEFQDTDPLQCEIIQCIYGKSDCPVVFVGDPKQAIYSFRGGDIHTYFHATSSIGPRQRTTLSRNYRSAKALVAAVSHVFTATGVKTPFFDDGMTAFPSVEAHHEKGKSPRIIRDAEARGALHWLLLPEKPDKEGGWMWGKGEAQGVAVGAVVEEIRGLIARSGDDPESLRPSDIAVLVRSNLQATIVQRALQEAGVPCIVKTLDSVYRSVAADELLTLLRAVAHPGNDTDVTAALLTPSLGYTGADVAALKQDAIAYAALAGRLIALRTVWEGSQNGFMRMATALVYQPGLAQGGRSVAARLLIYADAERRITDLLHLVELLHQESILHPGHDHLVHWLEQQIAEVEEEHEESSIRLESDAERVQIVTVHLSKGLEYPVVFCPFIYDGKAFKEGEERVVFFHNDTPAAGKKNGGTSVLTADIGSADRSRHFEKRVDEARSESIRHLYVALTRARQRCYVVWGHVNNMEDAALSYLLFKGGDRERNALKAAGHAGVIAPVRRLVKESKGAMQCSTITPAAAPDEERAPQASASVALAPREFRRPSVRMAWSYASYTSLTNDWVRSGKDTDAAVQPVPAKPDGHSIFAFPSGARTGKAWHAFFEHLAFGSGDGAVRESVDHMLKRHGFDHAFGDAMAGMVRTVLSTPLGPAGIRLAALGESSCVRELDFVFRCNQFQTAAFRGILAHADPGLPEQFARAAASLRDRDMQGFMIGTIDLLLHHEGRFYIVDYKSNTLGVSADRYDPSLLPGVLAREHYYLQYLVYTIAVHRYLRTRVPGYVYDTHFGGALYLFLRGMIPDTQNGVFFHRPSAGLIDALESRLFSREVV